MADLLEFVCPRCSASARAEFYGPCPSCVTDLRAGQALDQRAATVEAYVPKMNVTPNAVALKE